MRVRTISRTRRRSLFRSTMMCPYFGTMIPTRADDDGEAVTRTSNSPDFTRFPVRLTSSISGARDNRCARENLRCAVTRTTNHAVTRFAATCFPRQPTGALDAGVLRWQLHGQALASLLAATRQHFTPPARGHSLAKPMRLDPALITRTISRLTHYMILNALLNGS
jgi:hypothetical protein